MRSGSIVAIPSGRREARDYGWLKSYWLFSFDDYFDPNNLEFGALRVFNDDTIAPGRGFPAHRHEEMEIVTLVLSGRLTHRDSAGYEGMLVPGDVQRMSAGTGVLHSEMNGGKEPLHICQMWFLPNRGGLKPSYLQAAFPFTKWGGVLLPLVSGVGIAGALPISSSATLYGCTLEPGGSVVSEGGARKVFVYVLQGGLAVEGQSVGEGDQLRCSAAGDLKLSSEGGARFVLVDMPEPEG